MRIMRASAEVKHAPIPPALHTTMADEAAYSLGQIADLLSSDTAFAGMPRAQALRVAEVMGICEYEAGEKLTQEGSDNQGHLMLVVHGEAKITSKLVNNVDTLVFRRAVPGHLIGEVGFIDGQAHSATCTAITLVHVAVLQRDHLSRLIESQPLAATQLMAGLLKILAQRVRHANMTIQTLGVVHMGLQKEIKALKKAHPSS
jgi:CRP/FNR family transcriptional regulator, cyclic AMP receptor protein